MYAPCTLLSPESTRIAGATAVSRGSDTPTVMLMAEGGACSSACRPIDRSHGTEIGLIRRTIQALATVMVRSITSSAARSL